MQGFKAKRWAHPRKLISKKESEYSNHGYYTFNLHIMQHRRLCCTDLPNHVKGSQLHLTLAQLWLNDVIKGIINLNIYRGSLGASQIHVKELSVRTSVNFNKECWGGPLVFRNNKK